ncbi:coiled-coil domain-containing protein [Aureliella helgolandensis]|uniref:Tetratricopeptide repeat protein n=1 Tax=Aureliella helgolandensis TaxID=2527968 RepID=A0A518GF74_9BACT|nr:hypothetical protein [Aureliella helgolandensis]QDV27233.1 hypothetical protein Q31a_56210 [Aureliella helgolandensis]
MLVIYFSHAPPSLPTLDPLPTPMRAILTCLLKTTLTAVLCCGVLMSPASNSLVQAEEPYQRFLAKLQSEQLFDLALLYLDDLEASGELGAEFASELELERGLLTYQAGAVLSPTNPVRSSKLDEAGSHLRKFLETKPNHNRRGEARLKLGELLLIRAEEAKTLAGSEEADVPEAIRYYTEAHELFESTIAELAQRLEGLKGARVAASDSRAIAFRERVQQNLRQAQLLSAKAIDDRGHSRAVESPERIQDLTRALEMFSELYTKERSMIGVRNYALFYRSKLQQEIEKYDDAIDGYQRIIDLENVNVLRPLQTNALTELVQLLARQGKYPVAVDRADKWLSNLFPDEKESVDTLKLKLALAKVRLAWADKLKAADGQDRVAGRLIRNSRNDLRVMLRTPGAHLEETRALLSQLGIAEEDASGEELPKVKSFSEAVAAAEERLNRSETATIELQTLTDRQQDASLTEEEKNEVTAQLTAQQTQIDRDREQAIELLQTGFRLFQAEDSRADLTHSRFLLAYLLLKQHRPWDAIVVGEFTARSDPGSEQGLRCAAITLGGYGDLLRTVGEEQQAQLTAALKPFAMYLSDTWPASEEAAAATAALVQLHLKAGQWEQAQALLKRIPVESSSGTALRRDVGLTLYSQYLQQRRLPDVDAQKLQDTRSQAIELLSNASEALKPEAIVEADISTLNALTHLLLSDHQIDRATAILLDQETGPLAVLKANPDLASASIAMDSYRMAIQLIGRQVAEGKLENTAANDRIRSYIVSLQGVANAATDGQTILASIFVSLARDLEHMLQETTSAASRQRLASLFTIVAGEAAKADAFNTQYWAADTLLSVGDELRRDPKTRPQAGPAYAEAANVLARIADRSKSEPDWIEDSAMQTQVKLLLARSRKGAGDYAGSVAVLGEVLRETPMLLDVQIEAARTLQAWGSTKPIFFKTAYEGGPRDRKTGQNLFWGWGKIAQMTVGKEDYAEQFFDARYQLAYTRFKYGASLTDATQKESVLRRAEKDIQQTSALYPELGGPASKAKFEALLKEVRKAIGNG